MVNDVLVQEIRLHPGASAEPLDRVRIARELRPKNLIRDHAVDRWPILGAKYDRHATAL